MFKKTVRSINTRVQAFLDDDPNLSRLASLRSHIKTVISALDVYIVSQSTASANERKLLFSLSVLVPTNSQLESAVTVLSSSLSVCSESVVALQLETMRSLLIDPLNGLDQLIVNAADRLHELAHVSSEREHYVTKVGKLSSSLAVLSNSSLSDSQPDRDSLVRNQTKLCELLSQHHELSVQSKNDLDSLDNDITLVLGAPLTHLFEKKIETFEAIMKEYKDALKSVKSISKTHQPLITIKSPTTTTKISVLFKHHEITNSITPLPIALSTTLPPTLLLPAIAQAHASFTSKNPSDLSFSEGDLLLILKNDSEWWEGRLGADFGLVPSNHLSILSAEKLELFYVRKARAIYSRNKAYQNAPVDVSELSFEVGDEVRVLSSTSQRGREQLDSERWILASLNEKFGYVPENFTSWQ
jgi:hypothetical protein